MAMEVLTPPSTPTKVSMKSGDELADGATETLQFDSSRLDYELDGKKLLGKGLWSSVCLAKAFVKISETHPSGETSLTPPSSPSRIDGKAPCDFFAIKIPLRRDSEHVFQQEARILTRLQSRLSSSKFIAPFYGFDVRNSSLVFEAITDGSLESLLDLLKQMTEVARHIEIVSIFPHLGKDLVGGLQFIHDAGIVHADIKPGNVLLDILNRPDRPKPVIRARYIDFSASFEIDHPEKAANAGGTWDYMAPEQMRIKKDLNTPTPASDIWSLGITLLAIIVGGSPYTAACGDNVFIVREAIKTGEPLKFARMDHVIQKRLLACQNFVDGLKLALQKQRENRATAATWLSWFHDGENML